MTADETEKTIYYKAVSEMVPNRDLVTEQNFPW